LYIDEFWHVQSIYSRDPTLKGVKTVVRGLFWARR
jgi:hypothetical protein